MKSTIFGIQALVPDFESPMFAGLAKHLRLEAGSKLSRRARALDVEVRILARTQMVPRHLRVSLGRSLGDQAWAEEGVHNLRHDNQPEKAKEDSTGTGSRPGTRHKESALHLVSHLRRRPARLLLVVGVSRHPVCEDAASCIERREQGRIGRRSMKIQCSYLAVTWVCFHPLFKRSHQKPNPEGIQTTINSPSLLFFLLLLPYMLMFP